MAKRLTWEEVVIGDILSDFRPPEQRWIHYLVVDKRHGTLAISGNGVQYTSFFVLMPLDSDNDWELRLTPFDLNREFCTWRKKA